MNKKHLIGIIAVSSILFIGCQGPSSAPKGGERNPEKPVEEILPTMKISQGGQQSEIKLRSQTSRYMNDKKTILEISITSSKIAFCDNQSPVLKDGEEEIKITLKSKDGKTPISAMEYAKNENFEISAVRKTTAGDTLISGENFQTFKITDLNNAILRGNFSVVAKDLSMEGEYFTAICK